VSIELWLACVAASVILLVIPGPTILTVISYSVAHGRRANVPLVAAVALGDSTALVLSSAGRQLWVLALTFVALGTINATLYAVFAASARKLLASERAQRRFSLAGGSLLSMAGLWALLAKRAA